MNGVFNGCTKGTVGQKLRPFWGVIALLGKMRVQRGL